ncbi:MAG: hypothetical protein LBS58_04955 [Coriobacteriales bacterium]|jgi:hypothetical protein|nr:hypothetical protein [Coriobacteriales bacterium]
MIDQVTVFLENDKGRLAALCRTLGEAHISMHALTLADTADYGVARIIADTPAQAVEMLRDKGYRAKLTRVYAVAVPNHAGGLAQLLEAFDAAQVNVEYAYCFSMNQAEAIDVLRIDQEDAAPAIIAQAGYRLLEANDLYAL